LPQSAQRGTSFAEAIADALAITHWEAGVDGRDIEFVIGSAKVEGFVLEGIWLLLFSF